jgi:hypothetical protein
MRYIVCLLIIIAVGCETSPAKKQLASDQVHIEEDTVASNRVWKQYNKKDSIPKIIINKIEQSIEGNFDIANPDKPFQSTDVIMDDKLPWRQLRFLGNAGNDWIMTYKHGGIGLHYHFITCKIIADKMVAFNTGTSIDELETMTQIKQALSEGRIDFTDIGSKEQADKF